MLRCRDDSDFKLFEQNFDSHIPGRVVGSSCTKVYRVFLKAKTQILFRHGARGKP